jgi:hypothetical protein
MNAVLVLFGLLLGIGAFLFWLWMLIDCVTKESNQGNDRLVWVMIIIFTHIIGALIYRLVRQPQRDAELGR